MALNPYRVQGLLVSGAVVSASSVLQWPDFKISAREPVSGCRWHGRLRQASARAARSAASARANRTSRRPWYRAQASVIASGMVEGKPAGQEVP